MNSIVLNCRYPYEELPLGSLYAEPSLNSIVSKTVFIGVTTSFDITVLLAFTAPFLDIPR